MKNFRNLQHYASKERFPLPYFYRTRYNPYYDNYQPRSYVRQVRPKFDVSAQVIVNSPLKPLYELYSKRRNQNESKVKPSCNFDSLNKTSSLQKMDSKSINSATQSIKTLKKQQGSSGRKEQGERMRQLKGRMQVVLGRHREREAAWMRKQQEYETRIKTLEDELIKIKG